MRIIAGKWAGKPLTSPAGRVRPTGEEVRDAWLSMLGDEIQGAHVLDLYAGTGALGLEALSRGARRVDFVENGSGALHALKANIASLHARDRTRVFKYAALAFLANVRRDTYDFIFADPPYSSKQAARVVEWWQTARPRAALIIEHATDRPPPGSGSVRELGDTSLTMYAPPAKGEPLPFTTG